MKSIEKILKDTIKLTFRSNCARILGEQIVEEKMNKVESSLKDILDNSKMPISPYAIKTYYEKKEAIRKLRLEKYEDKDFLISKETQTDAKTFCKVCDTAIFEEGGECPNCD